MQATAAEEHEQPQQQECSNKAMDYDELTLNPLLAEIEAETTAGDFEKNKPRHYWTPKEEERFFEIWGRDNWCLTRHGKNTVYFARWAEELKEKYNIEVKLEEIQQKVNQTRAKFRQVKKQLDSEKTAIRWKKFDLIDKILRNQYRPKDAEPVPPEALEKNRDVSPTELNTCSTRHSSTPTSITSNSTTAEDSQPHGQHMVATEQQLNVEPNLVSVNIADPNLPAVLYNSSSSSDGRVVNYSTELFSDDIKTEYEEEIKMEEFQSGYDDYRYRQESRSSYMSTPSVQETEQEPQLHQLQTPLQLQQQQQQEQQQQQQQQYHVQQLPQQYTPTGAADGAGAHAHADTHMPQNLTQQQPPTTSSYQHTANSFAVANPSANHSVLNNQNHYGNSSSCTSNAATPAANTHIVAPPSANQYSNHTNNNNNYVNTANSSSSSNSGNMQPPRSSQPRKRRGPSVSTVNKYTPAAHQTADNNVEIMYIDELRKKNIILEEHKQISRKRLQLEERKIALMETFFPKCLELQEQILQKLNST